MLLTDPVYGTFDLTEPVLLELINSKPLQRLKGISQYGLPPEFYPHHRKINEQGINVSLLP